VAATVAATATTLCQDSVRKTPCQILCFEATKFLTLVDPLNFLGMSLGLNAMSNMGNDMRDYRQEGEIQRTKAELNESKMREAQMEQRLRQLEMNGQSQQMSQAQQQQMMNQQMLMQQAK
jgi:hypothetical protein